MSFDKFHSWSIIALDQMGSFGVYTFARWRSISKRVNNGKSSQDGTFSEVALKVLPQENMER